MPKECTNCNKKYRPVGTKTDNDGNDFFCDLVCFEMYCKEETRKEKSHEHYHYKKIMKDQEF